MVLPRRSARRSISTTQATTKEKKEVEEVEEVKAEVDDDDDEMVDDDNNDANSTSSSSSSASTASSSVESDNNSDDDSDDDSDSGSSSDSDDEGGGEDEKRSSSRLFVPFRTVGRINSSRPYCLNGNGGRHSGEATITVPMGNSFVIYKLDKIQPVMVSRSSPEVIKFVVSDESLQITVAIHSHMKLSLYRRVHILHTLSIPPAAAVTASSSANKNWTIRHVVNLGRQRWKSTGQNALLLALIASRPSSSDTTDTDGIPTLGNDSHDDDSSVSSNDSDNNSSSCCGEIILVVAHRNKMEFLKRIPLSNYDDIDTFIPSVALHPPTYVNKLVVGHAYKPQLILMRLDSQPKKLHTFNTMPVSSGGIACLQSTPSLDVIAAGTTKGFVHLIHLRQDVLLFTLTCGNQRINSISFCTAAMSTGSSDSKEAYVSVGSMDGTIRVWDLQKTELVWHSKVIHKGGVGTSQFLPGEPLLLSSGRTSNSLQMHVFEGRSARLLRHRTGHTSPPTVVRPTEATTTTASDSNTNNSSDASRCQMITGGSSDGTVRIVSTVRSVLDMEYSQGAGLDKRAAQLGIDVSELKLPVLLDLAMGGKLMLAGSSQNVNADSNGDMVSIHVNHSMAYVWSSARKSQCGPVLRQSEWHISSVQKAPPTSTHATSVVLSACGNFAIVGTKGGTIYKYNLQSGLPRGIYPKTSAEKKTKKAHGAGSVERTMKKLSKGFQVDSIAITNDNNVAMEQEAKLEAKKTRFVNSHRHTTPVVGLAVDALNRILTSVGTDGTILFWHVVSHTPAKKKLILPKSSFEVEVTKTCHLRSGNFLAIGMSDGLIYILDGNVIVRKFYSHSSIVDLAWSPDGRKLYSVGDSGIIHVWDVPTYTCMDAMKFVSGKPTSIAILGGGEILATTHRGQLGISLWSDKSFFQTVHLQSESATDNNSSSPSSSQKQRRLLKPILMREGYEDEHEIVKDDLGITTTAPQNGDNDDDDDSTNGNSQKKLVQPKQEGLITLSGLPPGHWKNLFHLELVKQRNKPTEAPTKPKSAPFFLQWRGNDDVNNPAANDEVKDKKEKESEEWDAVWDDKDENNDGKDDITDETKQSNNNNKRKQNMDLDGEENDEVQDMSSSTLKKTKKNKVTYTRSHLSTLLRQCDDNNFKTVTTYLSTMGPSSIDVEFSSLCHGSHDDDGLELLHLASKWLLDAFASNTNFELINAYLHRFLYLHGNVLAGMETWATKISSIKTNNNTEKENGTENNDESESMLELTQRMALLTTIKELKEAQRITSMKLRNKMQNTLCLLRHFSRMV